MGRVVGVLLLFCAITLKLVGQDVTVFNNNNKWVMSGVRVFAIGFPDTLKTNEQGIVNIDIFPSETKIAFNYPYFTTSYYTKDELTKLNYIIYLESSLYSQFNNLSYFTTKEYGLDLPFYIELINPEEQSSDNSNSDNTLLGQEGSSYIQALESKRIQLSIDGIRINDEIFRNGLIHKLFTYDMNIFSEVRKLNTPGFVSFSPDAIGGVYFYFIKIPAFSLKKEYHLNAMSSYHSSNSSVIGSINFSYSQKNLSSITLFSFGHFGDIVMGKNRKSLYVEDSLYGLKEFVVQQNTNIDTIIKNTNPFVQIGTKFEQFYFSQKIALKLSKKDKLFARFHYIRNSKMQVYSATCEKINQNPRYAEAFFMPQNKFIANLNYYFEGKKFLYDIVSFSISDINYNEYRYTRRYKSDLGLHQTEEINTFKTNIDIVKKIGEARFIYGFSFSSTSINSRSYLKNIKTNEYKIGLNRYPNEGALAQTVGIYVNYKNLKEPNFHYTIASRLDYKNIYAQFSNLMIPIDFTEISMRNNLAPAISVFIESNLFTKLKISSLLSVATQLPSLDQMSKTMFKNFVITIPTKNLKTENDLSLKLMLSLDVTENIKIYSHSMCTYMYNYIMLKKGFLNGVDTLNFSGYIYDVAVFANNKSALMIGNSTGLNFKQQLWSEESFIVSSVNFSISKGFNLSDSVPIPFIYPFYGFLDIKFQIKNFYTSVNYSFNGQKKYNSLSLLGEDFIEKATSNGFLPWHILNLSVNYNISKSFSVGLDVENLFDNFYIRYGTDFAQNGRNLILTIKFSL